MIMHHGAACGIIGWSRLIPVGSRTVDFPPIALRPWASP